MDDVKSEAERASRPVETIGCRQAGNGIQYAAGESIDDINLGLPSLA